MNQPTTPSPQRHPTEAVDGPTDAPERRRAIVAGFGPIGRMTAEQLERAGLQVTVVELNLHTIERQLHLDRRVLYGDVTDPEILRRAGIDGADALILTIPNEAAAVQACEVARQLNPAIFIAARTNFLSQGLLATQAGADHVVVEEVVTAEAMQRAVVDRLLK